MRDPNECHECGFPSPTHRVADCKGGLDLELVEVAQRFPVGMRVRYWPASSQPEFVVTTVRTEPWRLGHGRIVLSLDGRSGGVRVSNVAPVDEPEPTEDDMREALVGLLGRMGNRSLTVESGS